MADDIGGVWRTIGGRRVFIKDGQSLASAMKESGKFPKNKRVQKTEEIKEQIKTMIKKNTELKKQFEEVKHEINKKEDEYQKTRSKYIKENYPGVGKKSEKYKKIRQDYDNSHKKNYDIENTKIYNEYNKALSDYKLYREKTKNYITKSDDNTLTWKYNYEDQLKKYLIKEASGYETIAEAMYYSDGESYEKYKKFSKLAKENDYIISQSPYGSSMYAIPKGDYVDWGYKPMDSYRLADHWGFESRGKIHCRLGKNEEYITDFEIGKWNGSYYEKI